eukprot:CAMPEP_0119338596 /NCGR_PEP_ID=MMETSP1333-20130426/96474_1 /TAXON_ID=418940 /ORGANISM="Scyphosphaera apsteinii, Strain RCC1455" /LENGTH=417 /DNA_ID=CAMNT_0007349919 /DNA_START=93 /DNA_END=1347 /DNA_ORIENTATION=+
MAEDEARSAAIHQILIDEKARLEGLVLQQDLSRHVPQDVLIEPPSTVEVVHYGSNPVCFGLVCMTKSPHRLETWLRFHAEILHVMKFWLRVEDTPALEELLSKPPWATLVTAIYSSGTRDFGLNFGGVNATGRQYMHVTETIPRARAAGVTHLLHIDDDELLYCPHGVKALVCELQRVADGVADVHALALEALVPRGGCEDAFTEARVFRHKRSAYGSYGSAAGSAGKSFGVIAVDNLTCDGPHHFRAGWQSLAPRGDFSSTYLLPPCIAVVLHYESCDYIRWKTKFTELARRHAEVGGTLLFPPGSFYAESLSVCSQLQQPITEGAAEREAAELWGKWKHEPQGLPLPITTTCVWHNEGITLIPPPAASLTAALKGACPDVGGIGEDGKHGDSSDATDVQHLYVHSQAASNTARLY